MRPSLVQARFYGILDAGYLSGEAQYEARARALIDGGADIVELRAKEADEAALRRLIDRLLPVFLDARVPLTLNDDVTLAAQYDGLGAHIGQDDMAVAAARSQLGEDRILGLSTHSLAQAQGAIAQAAVLDYFCVGPVYATATKPEYAAVGLDLVAEVAALAPTLPWFAIGGVNRRTANAVQAAGAPRVVVVSDALQADDTAAVVREIRRRFVD